MPDANDLSVALAEAIDQLAEARAVEMIRRAQSGPVDDVIVKKLVAAKRQVAEVVAEISRTKE